MRAIVILAAALLLGGCAFGRTYSYTSPVSMAGLPQSSTTVALGVHDTRPYIVSGNKPERFVGLFRGGFGNPFDVNTESGNALAADIRDSIAQGLRAKGMTVTSVALRPAETPAAVRRRLAETKARRVAIVTLNEWKTDTMVNTSIYHDVTLAILDESGQTLATNQMSGSSNLGGLGISPGGAISETFKRKFEALFDDEKIAAALK